MAAILIFILAYILFVALPEKRTLIAVLGAVSLIILRVISPGEAFLAVNWNVMGIFVGTLVIADIFMESRMPAYLAEKIVNCSPSILWSILWICIMTSFISAFIDNVPFLAAMLPVAISIAQKTGIDPSLFLFVLLIGASLGGNITPIGASANIVVCWLLKKEGYNVRF